MCGVFGFISQNGGEMNMRALAKVALATERRGHHAWGIAWIDAFGRLKMYKQAGRISGSLKLLGMARDARFLIGHCRWSTSGSPFFNHNNHPHPCDGGWFVHNGQVKADRDPRLEYDLHATSDCDSEVIGLLAERMQGGMMRRLIQAARICDEPELAVLGLWKPGQLVAIRKGKPLHIGTTADGYYLASLADGLPGKVLEVADGKALEFTRKGVRHESV